MDHCECIEIIGEWVWLVGVARGGSEQKDTEVETKKKCGLRCVDCSGKYITIYVCVCMCELK